MAYWGEFEELKYRQARWRAMMKDVFGFVQERRHVIEGTTHVPEVAVLHSHDHLMGDKLQFFPDSEERKKRGEPFEGVSRMFMHHARHYTGAQPLLKSASPIIV